MTQNRRRVRVTASRSTNTLPGERSSHGTRQAQGDPEVDLDDDEQSAQVSRPSVLSQAQRAAEGDRLRPQGRGDLRALLLPDRPPVDSAGRLLPNAGDRLL